MSRTTFYNFNNISDRAS